MRNYEPEWGDEADVPRIARAMAMEKKKGNAPLYLDMSGIPEHLRDTFIHSKVKWMDYFFRKLGNEAKTDMFGKTPYYALNQMTKMGMRTGPDCRSDVPALLAAGLAQAGCANHFAGFHIGLCVGNGWIAGRSAIEDLDRLRRRASSTRGKFRHCMTRRSNRSIRRQRRVRPHPARPAGGDVCLRHRHPQARGPAGGGATIKLSSSRLSSTIAAHRTHTSWCGSRRPRRCCSPRASSSAPRCSAPNHGSVTSARISRTRDDKNWLVWIDIEVGADGKPAFVKTPIPTPLCPVTSGAVRPTRLKASVAVGGV